MPPEMPPEMPLPDAAAMPPALPMPPAGSPEEGLPPAGDPAAAIDQILAAGAASGAEILSALEQQGFMVTEGAAPMEAPIPEEMPPEEPMPEEPMPEEMDLLSAARAGEAEADNLRQKRRDEIGY